MSGLFLTGCNKCGELASLICECEETSIARENCKKNMDMKASHGGFERAVNEDKCAEVLVSSDFNCEAVRNHDYEKCGMTRKAP